jgi:hypothetical protein
MALNQWAVTWAYGPGPWRTGKRSQLQSGQLLVNAASFGVIQREVKEA